MASPAYLLDLLHLADSSFPTGSFVHSAGLESLQPKSPSELEALLRVRLRTAVARVDLVFLLAAHAAFVDEASAATPGLGDGPPDTSREEAEATDPSVGAGRPAQGRSLVAPRMTGGVAPTGAGAGHPRPGGVRPGVTGEEAPVGTDVRAVGRLVELDGRLEAVLLARESRLASAQVGTQLLRNACDLYPTPGLHAFLAAATPHHAVVVFGAVAAALDVPAAVVAEAYAFQHVRGLVAAAQRLVRLGQRDAQRILHTLKPAVRDAVERAGAIPVEEAGAFAPLWDVAAMAHERAPVRLFVS